MIHVQKMTKVMKTYPLFTFGSFKSQSPALTNTSFQRTYYPVYKKNV